ncbi:Bestrophin, RFP-TM, chloride channel-domain-containing protein [Leucosporidium creatinivorum]|uniref:Bestrophin, RFP-TM, chloride channel-domain-containing protein n=1 Tax=Leucosporidium creatinivorum TaxID=106004 RepID=A0A1Y2G2J6_9BASI|nr:Bestrophin, RFP-TM, chloride channel-domain-containing protein [Leucosporidium creatinivorum]
MDTLQSVLPGLPTLDSLPQPFSSLNLLLAAEEEDSKRIRVSKLGWWVDVRRIRGSAILRIWRAVFIVTVWSIIVAVADLIYGRQLGLTNNVTPLLSVVVGLLLVFRNGSAYARWDDGRKSFAKMISTVRTLSRSTWINVGAPGPSTGRLTSDGTRLPPPSTNDHQGISAQDHDQKIKALRLMVAFVVSVKHHVRGEYGLEYEDLSSLLPAKFREVARTTGFGWGAAEADAYTSPPPASPLGLGPELRHLSSHPSLRPSAASSRAGSPSPIPTSPKSMKSAREGERRPLLGVGDEGESQRRVSHRSTESTVILADYMAKPSLPLPLVIAHQLGLYFASCKRKGLLESVGPAGFNAFQTSVGTLVDQFTNVERLATVGIPTVYGIHLKQCVSLFLFTLPLVLVEVMGFSMCPFVTVVAFTLMGIEGIASEIEQPFGVDDSDLPLDLFCAELRNEVEHTIYRLAAGTDDWAM